MSNLKQNLAGEGICAVNPLLSIEEIAFVNSKVDHIFKSRELDRRSYVTVDEMYSLGIFDIVFKKNIQDLFLAAISDPVFYHFHMYEIAGGNNSSHIFSESLSGWHRDPDSDYVPNEPTHLSLFIYLTEVGPEDGPFQFLPGDPTRLMTGSTPIISVEGPIGFSFLWHRSYYHRAAPNRAPRRRRLLKISVQRNAYPSVHLARESFCNLQAVIPAGDPRLDIFLGRMQGRQAPALPPVADPEFRLLTPTGLIDVPTVDIMKAQIKGKVRTLKQLLRSNNSQREQAVAAYD